MENISLREKCRISSNTKDDNFVGIRSENGNLEIIFPSGFALSDTEEDIRDDVRLLLDSFSVVNRNKESYLYSAPHNNSDVIFPYQLYRFIIEDYLSRGVFREKKRYFKKETRGKVNWKRTIATQKTYIQDNEVFYLNYITLNSGLKKNELITRIHEYLIYDAFLKIGWLYGSFRPPKPSVEWNRKAFIAIISAKLSVTFNDTDRRLFTAMLQLIECKGDSDAELNYIFGSYDYQYEWQKMIDIIFGVSDLTDKHDKSEYFPKARWELNDGSRNRGSLYPDTILINKNDIFILDAKYYKYGTTGQISDLPELDSIHKQITYGEFSWIKKRFSPDSKVYNAFILPFNAELNGMKDLEIFGEALSEWKNNRIEYHIVIGMFIDTKHLMKICVKKDRKDIEKITVLIRKYIQNKMKNADADNTTAL